MQIGLIGVNHTVLHVEQREVLAQVCQRRFGSDCSLHCNAPSGASFVLLSTCNRTELYFSAPDLDACKEYCFSVLQQELPSHFELYTHVGRACFFHLCRVTAGLDSAIIFETEIQGQVKNAYGEASRFVLLSAELHYCFQRALKIGKLLRTKAPLEAGMPTIEDIIYNLLKEHFGELAPLNFLFVGASETNCKIAQALQKKNCSKMTVSNRTLGRMQLVSEHLNLSMLDWEQKEQWKDFDVIFFATKYPHYLLTPNNVFFTKRPCVIMDLSVPRNVDPKVLQGKEGVFLYNIDELDARVQKRRHIKKEILMTAQDILCVEVEKNIDLFYRKEKAKRDVHVAVL